MMNFEEPVPLQNNDSLSDQAIEDKDSLWVQANVLKLSHLFGATFEGCDKVSFDLLLRIDQNRAMKQRDMDSAFNSVKR